MIEGDHTTLTCDTSLSPLRETTELHFSFYRDGQNVQSYSTASRFSIPSASMKDSGSYTCQVRTLTNEVEKTSMPLHVEAKRKGGKKIMLLRMSYRLTSLLYFCSFFCL